MARSKNQRRFISNTTDNKIHEDAFFSPNKHHNTGRQKPFRSSVFDVAMWPVIDTSAEPFYIFSKFFLLAISSF